MASKNAVLNIIFGADTKDLDKALGGVSKRLRRTAEDIGSLGQSLSIGLTAPLAGLGALATKNAVDSAKALAQVQAAVTSTGGAAGRSVGQLEEMATSLQRMSLFDDDQILKEVTANLLTFTRVTGKEFDQAQVAILNMSTRLGTDLTSASIQVGKALNDPIAGVKALGRAGVQFTADQKAQITAMQESGNIAGAQAIILKELETQFGGASQAAADTDPYTQLSNEVGNLSEDFGIIINEALLPLVGYIRRAVDAIKGWSTETKTTVLVIGGLLAVLGPTLIAVSSLVSAYTTIRGALAAAKVAQLALNASVLANPYVAAAAAIGVLIAALLTYQDAADKARAAKEDFDNSISEQTGKAAMESISAEAKRVNAELEKQQRIYAELKRTQELQGAKVTDNTIRQLATTGELVRVLQEQRVELAEQYAEAARQNREQERQRKNMEAATKSTTANAQATKDNTAATEKDAEAARRRALEAAKEAQEIAELTAEMRDLQTQALLSAAPLRTAFMGSNLPELSSLNLAEIDGPDEEVLYEEPIAGAERFVQAHLRAKAAAQDFATGAAQAVESAAENITAGFGEIVGAAIASGEGLAGFGSMVLGGLADLAIQVGKIAVGVGISVEGIKKALQTLNPIVAIAAGIALIALGSAAKTALANRANSMGGDVPALASGGLTTGPTLAMIGDNPSGKEAVIPFERMGEFLNMAGAGQSQHVTVSGRISGNDILFINERTSRDRSRVRGY